MKRLNFLFLIVKKIVSVFFLFFLLLLNGCTTTLTSKPATDEATGIRYSLPAPHIFMNPNPDGTVSVSVEYLPDPNNTYTLGIASYLSSSTIDVKLKNGMLASVSLNSDSSSNAASALSTASALKSEDMKKENTEKKDKADKAKAKADSVKSAADAVQVQIEKIELLKVKQKFYTDNPTAGSDAEKFAVNLGIIEEELKLTQLQTRLGWVKAGDGSFNAPENKFHLDGSQSGIANAYGPVLLRVLSTDPNGVKLVALEAQQQFATSTSGMPGGTLYQKLTLSPSDITVKKEDVQKTIVIASNRDISEVDKDKSSLFDLSVSATQPVLVGRKIDLSLTSNPSKTLHLSFSSPLKQGRYRLDIYVTTAEDDEEQVISLDINWPGNE